jgi:4-amino-4-deoxy-L-arabinose transferase-like glycosyltransferase
VASLLTARTPVRALAARARADFRSAALILAVAAGLHGLLYAPLVSTHVETDSWTYQAAANAVLDGSYSTPLYTAGYYVHPVGFYDITGVLLRDEEVRQALERQAFRPPGYPLFLALFGGADSPEGEWAAIVGQAVLFGLGAWLLALTVRRWWGESVALLATALYALDPWSKHYVSSLLSETLAGFLALAGLYAFTRAWQERSTAWWALAGSLAAALTLTRAVFVFTVLLVVLAAVSRSASPRVRLTSAAASAVAALVLLGPWLGWTASVSGAPVLASWGEGYNFLVGAHGEGLGRTQTEVSEDPAFLADYTVVRRSFPSREQLLENHESHTRYLRSADAELRGRSLSTYGERLREEPVSVAWEALYRSFFLWNAHEDWRQPDGAALGAMRVVDWVTILLAAVGAVFALARGGAGRAAVVLLAVYTALLATHHVEARFAMPLRGVLLSLVALALVELAARMRARTA